MSEKLTPKPGKIINKPYRFAPGSFSERKGCGTCPTSCGKSHEAFSAFKGRIINQVCHLVESDDGVVWCGAPAMDEPNV